MGFWGFGVLGVRTGLAFSCAPAEAAIITAIVKQNHRKQFFMKRTPGNRSIDKFPHCRSKACQIAAAMRAGPSIHAQAVHFNQPTNRGRGHHRHGGVGRRGQDRRRAAVPVAGRALRQGPSPSQGVCLRGWRLLLARPGPGRPDARNAELPGPRLRGGQEEDRRRVAGRAKLINFRKSGSLNFVSIKFIMAIATFTHNSNH